MRLGRFEVCLGRVWHGLAQSAKRSDYTKPWPSIESRALRFERRLRCVWIGFEARLRCVWHEFAQHANVAKRSYDTKAWPYIESRALRFEKRLT